MNKLLKDGEIVLEFENDIDIYKYLHKKHPFSVDYAFKYEGYSVEIENS